MCLLCCTTPHSTSLQPVVTDISWSVSVRLSVCLLVTAVCPTKKWSNCSKCCLWYGLRCAQGTMFLVESRIPPRGGAILVGISRPTETNWGTMWRNFYANIWQDRGVVWRVYSSWLMETSIRWGPWPPWVGAFLGKKCSVIPAVINQGVTWEFHVRLSSVYCSVPCLMSFNALSIIVSR